jgi:hypothetical protein
LFVCGGNVQTADKEKAGPKAGFRFKQSEDY